SKTQCLPVLTSIDPNDKQVFPTGFTANHVVQPGTQLEYMVRFQNTGNDTAFTAYVVDSLDRNLNVESLEIGAVSHPYEVTLHTTRQGRNVLRFQFDHINLPDSTTNELQSHGFIQYRISPKTNISLGTQVKNEAAIYFDYNPPVVTNQTLTTFDNLVLTDTSLNSHVQIIASAQPFQKKQDLVSVFPNPFSNKITLQSGSAESLSVSLCDLMGKEIQSARFTRTGELSLSHLPDGVYLLKIPSRNQTLKLVKQE
ncbi:MAG TPA: T9SS type A sorting domain-containing protein, partial [Catalimonadaceae bacterium]|nr:T9SS type A sorting domain-containing protein [Catalimonadaceae bacterium]